MLTLKDLQALAASVGFPDPNLAAAVAMAESTGSPTAIANEPNGTRSYGLWQINDVHGYDPQSLMDPVYNARAALAVSSNGTNWKPWSTYNHGDYRQYYAGPGGPVSALQTIGICAAIVAIAGATAYYITNAKQLKRAFA